MSATYRRLCEGIPEAPGYDGGRFLTEPKKVRAWVEALPRANAQATQQELRRALDSLSGQKLESGQRFAVLEELRPAVLEQAALLESLYASSPLPLPPDFARSADSAEAFHLLLAHGYRRAVAEQCAPSGSVPFLRGSGVVSALVRSTFHYSRALGLAWRIYHAPRPGTWQGLHRVARFAAEIKLDGKAVDISGAGTSVDARTLYLQTLLMAITNPYGYSQGEQDALWPVARGYVARCGLRDRAPDNNSPVVPEDADRGPGPGAKDEAHSLWLDLRAFAHDVDGAAERLRYGYAELSPGPGVSIRLSGDALSRLQRAFGLQAARRYQRLPAVHSIDTVVGLSGLHFYLAGQRDFDTFIRQSSQTGVQVMDRAAWTMSNTDASRVPRISARVLDQSLGGYRITWSSADMVRVRVGELVGLTFADPDEVPEWMVGMIRWLRYETDGSLSAGIELMSRRTAAVALRSTGSGTAPLRAVELSLQEVGGARRFLAPATLDTAARRIEVIQDVDAGDSRVAGQDVLDALEAAMNAGDYVLVHELPAKVGSAA